jgi:hypothetical protein
MDLRCPGDLAVGSKNQAGRDPSYARGEIAHPAKKVTLPLFFGRWQGYFFATTPFLLMRYYSSLE